ncbi:MAG TPA: hypothetical protein VFG23_03120, partial [Polyangia bacterium]|nr:hypothetical protein [Polyangia bacterium]
SWTLWLRYFAFQRATTPNFPRRRGGYPNSAALRPPREKHDFVNGLLDDLTAWGYFDPIQLLDAALTHSSLHTLPLLLMGTEPAIQRIAVSLYQAGARDADLEFEMGAHAMSQRNYTEAEQHLARVTDGAHTVQAALLRTLAFELLGKLDEAQRSLDAIALGQPSSGDASAWRWLRKSLDRAYRQAAKNAGGK